MESVNFGHLTRLDLAPPPTPSIPLSLIHVMIVQSEGGKEDLLLIGRPAEDGSRDAWQGLPGETVRVANDLQVGKLYRCVIQVL